MRPDIMPPPAAGAAAGAAAAGAGAGACCAGGGACVAAGAGAARPWDGAGAARCGALAEGRLLWRGMAVSHGRTPRLGTKGNKITKLNN